MPASAEGLALNGAGASFPAPLYGAWADAYAKSGGPQIGYKAVGSGAGVQQIEAAAVDFGGSDKPLPVAELDKNGLVQFPTVLGGVVPVINMPTIPSDRLKLDGEVLAAMFSGEIGKWNDPRIQRLNPGLKLPDWPITVVHRSDKSGSTFLLSTYLSAVSPKWKAEKGAGDLIKWPAGLEGSGNAGIPDIMKGTVGTLGYVDYNYAIAYKLDTVRMKNREGAYVAPSAAAFSAAAAKADWSKAPGFNLLLLDQPGARSWPLTAATFLLVRKDAPKDRVAGVLHFMAFSFAQGDKAADQLGFVPLPADVKARVTASWTALGGS